MSNNNSDFVYVNLDSSFPNNPNVDPNSMQPATASISFNYPVIEDPMLYFLNLNRLYIENVTAPLLSLQPVLNQSNPNLLYFQFSMGYNGVYSDPISVMYVPQNNTIPIPVMPLTEQTTNTPYYDVYFYSTFLDMMNTAMATCLSNLNGKINTGQTVSPILYYDPIYAIVLSAPKAFGQNNSVIPQTGKIQLYFNSYVKPLLQGMPCLYVQNPTGCNNMFLMYDTVNNTLNDNWNITMQSTSCCSGWGIRKIVLVSNLPVVSEYVMLRQSSNTSTAQIKILTDLVIDSSLLGSYSGLQQYFNTMSLRNTNMSSSSPLYNITMSLYYQTSYGDLKPLFMQNGGSFGVKLEFVKKNALNLQ